MANATYPSSPACSPSARRAAVGDVIMTAVSGSIRHSNTGNHGSRTTNQAITGSAVPGDTATLRASPSVVIGAHRTTSVPTIRDSWPGMRQ